MILYHILHLTPGNCPSNQSPQGLLSELTSHKTPKTPRTMLLETPLDKPWDKKDDKVLTHYVRRRLHMEPNVLRIKTGGQPLHFVKVVKPRKHRIMSSSPLKKKRARAINKIRCFYAGKDSGQCQQTAELKSLSKRSRLNICHNAGVTQKAKISAQMMLAMKTALGLTTNQMRTQRRHLLSCGVSCAPEKEEQSESNKLLGDDTLISKPMFLWHADENAPGSVHGKVRRQSAAVYIRNLTAFVHTLLDNLHEAGKLDIHKFKRDEIHLKLGSDFGGGYQKVTLQCCNVDSPNSDQHINVIACFDGKDYHANLVKMTDIFTDAIKELKASKWRDHRVVLFLCGDYAFLTNLYGLSGAAGKHPCLWCHVSTNDMQKYSIHEPEYRTLKTLKACHQQFKIHGSVKKNASDFKNAINAPLWPISLSNVCPSYLHLLLGIQKKHHLLLEQACHDIDIQIAKEIAETDKLFSEECTVFEEYVKKMQKI